MGTLKTLAGAATTTIFLAGAAQAATLINNATQGLYNSGLGTSLNGTNPAIDDNGIDTFLFPNNNSTPNDPTFANRPSQA